MKRLIYFCQLFALLVLTSGAVTAKPLPVYPTATANSNATATDGDSIMTIYDMPNVFADDISVKTTSSINIYTTNIFADDVFADDVKTSDVLIADIITTNTTTTDDGITVANMELNPNPNNGMLSIKTELTGKLIYYTEPHTDKAGNIINGGENILYVEKMLFPGVYLCHFEGPDGTVAEIKVVCKK